MDVDTELPKYRIKEKAIQYNEEHNTEKSVIMTVAGETNTKLDYNSLAKGDGRMCTVFDEIAKEGEAKGEAKGIIETGLEFGLSESDILSRLQKKLDVSLQVAQEYLAMFGKQTV